MISFGHRTQGQIGALTILADFSEDLGIFFFIARSPDNDRDIDRFQDLLDGLGVASSGPLSRPLGSVLLS